MKEQEIKEAEKSKTGQKEEGEKVCQEKQEEE